MSDGESAELGTISGMLTVRAHTPVVEHEMVVKRLQQLGFPHEHFEKGDEIIHNCFLTDTAFVSDLKLPRRFSSVLAPNVLPSLLFST